MRLFGLLLGLGLTLLPAAFVETEEWVEVTYEQPGGWILDVPASCGERALYSVTLVDATGEERLGYTSCVVAEYDEDVATITVACPDAVELLLSFAQLSEWLAIEEGPCEPLTAQQQQAELVCASNWCECSGKCSACCPEGTLPRCICSGAGSCRCTPVAEPDENDPES